MRFYLSLVGLLFITEGVVLILSPKKIIKFATDLLKKNEPKRIALFPLFFGILLMLSASASAVSWLIFLLGLGGIAKAVYMFMAKAEDIRSHRWFSLPINTYRAVGILVLVLGVIIFISRV